MTKRFELESEPLLDTFIQLVRDDVSDIFKKYAKTLDDNYESGEADPAIVHMMCQVIGQITFNLAYISERHDVMDKEAFMSMIKDALDQGKAHYHTDKSDHELVQEALNHIFGGGDLPKQTVN